MEIRVSHGWRAITGLSVTRLNFSQVSSLSLSLSLSLSSLSSLKRTQLLSYRARIHMYVRSY